MQPDNSNVVGSMQYDQKNNLALGTSSSFQIPTTSPYTPSGSVAPANITAQSLSSATPVVVPTPNTSNIGHDIATSVGDSTAKMVADSAAQQDAIIKASDMGAKAQNSSVMDYVNKLFGGKSAIQAGQADYEQSQGIDTLNNSQDDLINKISNETRAYNGALNNIRTGFMTTAQAQAAHNAVGNDYGYSLANYGIALDAVNKRIDGIFKMSDRLTAQKLAPIDSQIAYVKDFVMKNIDNLSAKEQATAKALTDNLTVQRQNQKDLESARASMIAEVSKNGGGADQATVQAIQSATTLDGIATAGSKYIGKMDFLKSQAEIRKLNSETSKNYGTGSGGGGVYSTSPVNVVNTPKGVQAVSTYTLAQGDDPYQIAQNNGTDMATLKTLNPSVTDWTKLPVGAKINLPDSTSSWLNGKTPEQVQAYNSIPPAQKASIAALVNGDILLEKLVTTRGAQGTKDRQNYINLATSIDPNFSPTTNTQRVAYKTKFNDPNGKEQGQINAINTALGHLAEFNTSSQALGNSALLPYNKLKNYLSENTGNPAVSNFNTIVTALAGELAAVYKGGTSPTDQETEQWRNNILSSFSTSQQKGVADTTSSLISNKMIALNNSFKNVMGKYPDAPIVNPDVLGELQTSGVNITPITDRLSKQGYSIPTPTTDQKSPAGTVAPEVKLYAQNALKQSYKPAFILDHLQSSPQYADMITNARQHYSDQEVLNFLTQ